MTTEKLLREYVRAVISEDEGGGDGGVYGDLSSADAGMSPYGVSFGSGQDLYKVFVAPFTDVVATAAGKTKEISQKGQTLLRVAFEAVATTLVPILRDSYAEIFAKEEAALDMIRNEYGEIYAANWDALRDNDVVLAAFMYNPARFLTTKLAQKSPKVVAKLISILSGGTLDGWLKKVADKFGWDKASGANKSVHGGSFGPMEGVIREEDDKHSQVSQVLANDRVKAKLADSLLVKRMQQDGQALVRGTLEQVYKQASAVLGAKSLQELQQKLGKPLKGMDKLAQLPQQERQKAEQVILAGAKKSMREFYVKSLEGQVKKALEAGVPEDHPFINDYRRTVSKIKAL
jgi:hypothetical protein